MTPEFTGGVTQKAITFGPGGDVLLVRTADHPWVPPGGRVQEGEDAEAALERELREETGLSVTVERPVETLTEAWVDADGEFMFTVVYHCETTDSAVTLNDEHDDYVWVEPREATDRLALPGLERAVERALADRRRESRVIDDD